MLTLNDEALRLAEVLWNYHDIPNRPSQVDLILALGSSDIRVASEAAKLVLEGFSPLLVLSGGHGKVTAHDGGESEARRFANVAEAMGISKDMIVLEEEAANTGDNFVKSHRILTAAGLIPKTAIFVTKPYMKRRALATALKQWPGIDWIPHAPSIPFQKYPDAIVSTEQMIQLMVGDLQRIAIYPAMGFQAEQHIPSDVWDAYLALVTYGFNKYVIKT